MLSIGEFSKVSQLTIKTIRYYHELGILIPERIDRESNYRYYGDTAIYTAQKIRLLKDIGFSLTEIKSIIEQCKDDDDLIGFVERKLNVIDNKIKEYNNQKKELSFFLNSVNIKDKNTENVILEEKIPAKLICGIRFQGKYHEIGNYFKVLFKKAGRYIHGKPFALYYDQEYKEDNADIEACIEVKKKVTIDGINCRLLNGGDGITTIHKGSYETIGSSYKRIFDYCYNQKYKIAIPGREYHIKGPGIIFKRNPEKFISKIELIKE